MKRVDPTERWDGEAIKRFQGTPQQPDPKRPGLAIPIRVNFDAPGPEEPLGYQDLRNESVGRRMRITKEILRDYDHHNDDCEGCRRQRAGMHEQRPHTESCRDQLLERMRASAEGRRRIQAEEERIMRKLERAVEESDAKRRRGEAGEDDPQTGARGSDAPAHPTPHGSTAPAAWVCGHCNRDVEETWKHCKTAGMT